MNSLLIAGFAGRDRASRATGRLTDEGAQRQDLSLVTGSSGDGSYALTGDGVLSARLRLAGRDASLLESLRWIGLDDQRALDLVALLDGGGGLVVLAVPSGGLSLERGRMALQDESPSSFTTVRILSSGTAEEPALRVHTSVGSEPQSLSLHTLRERIAVEKRTVRRHATEAEIELLQDATYEFKETTQVLEVHTVPYVVGEVVVSVHRSLEEQEIEERVRKMRAEVEEL